MAYRQDVEEQCRAEWGKLVADLNDSNRRLKARVDELEGYATKARAFDAMMRAVRENEVVKGSWDKFMGTLRLCGYDQR